MSKENKTPLSEIKMTKIVSEIMGILHSKTISNEEGRILVAIISQHTKPLENK